MESLMLTSSRVFSHATTMEFQRSYVVFRTCLNKLATHAYEKKLLRYHFRPKLHQLGHLVYHFLPKNPRYYSCYVDEDFVSRTKQLALKCHPLFVSQQVCFRYSLRMCLSWAGQVCVKKCECWKHGRNKIQGNNLDQPLKLYLYLYIHICVNTHIYIYHTLTVGILAQGNWGQEHILQQVRHI